MNIASFKLFNDGKKKKEDKSGIILKKKHVS